MDRRYKDQKWSVCFQCFFSHISLWCWERPGLEQARSVMSWLARLVVRLQVTWTEEEIQILEMREAPTVWSSS